ncbi:MAG: pyruvate carboxylase [Thermoanaerobacterium sp.]|nr:pyruvate carboxylase [Thermoanaerobacterium sp.]
MLREKGTPVHLNRSAAEKAVQKVRGWSRDFDWAEPPFKDFDHMVTRHKMPDGTFPSSFEQAEKGGFLNLMPYISLKLCPFTISL